MNRPYIYVAKSLDKARYNKAQIRTTDIHGNTVNLSGWFDNADNAIKELIKRQKESSVYGCR